MFAFLKKCVILDLTIRTIVHFKECEGKYMANSNKISQKQQEILEYLKEVILKRGYPPTVREICEKVKLKSTSSVHSHLETLEKRGYIKRDPSKPRAIEICDDSFQMVRT